MKQLTCRRTLDQYRRALPAEAYCAEKSNSKAADHSNESAATFILIIRRAAAFSRLP